MRNTSGSVYDQVTVFSWDHHNRLIGVDFKTSSVASPNKTIRYEYDVFDRLISRTIDADGSGIGVAPQTMFFVYDGDNALFELLDTDATIPDDAALFRRNLWGSAVDQLMAYQDVGTWAVDWLLTDHLGSVRDTVNNNGPKTNHIRYDAFGNIASEWVASNWNTQRVRYTGKFFDSDAGLQYNMHRWYEPSTGIWISQDPIGFGGGDYNLYRYVGNEPTNWIDSTGLHEGPTPKKDPVQELIDRLERIRRGDVHDEIELGIYYDLQYYDAHPGELQKERERCEQLHYRAEQIGPSTCISADYDRIDPVLQHHMYLDELRELGPLYAFFGQGGGIDLIPAAMGGGALVSRSSSVSVPRTAGPRSFTQRLADYTENPGAWRSQSLHAEPATSIRARGGVSEQIIYRHTETGETLIRHRVTDARGHVLDDHFRPCYKPRVGEVDP